MPDADQPDASERRLILAIDAALACMLVGAAVGGYAAASSAWEYGPGWSCLASLAGTAAGFVAGGMAGTIVVVWLMDAY